ncbi:hypothetical protein C2G38_2149958 [Gigaspora rosea]|uniref:Uncharacterized protein n=1 Tax=Gigaspora rosea TaxID=44941 RepID=A0A397U051_9GLOM|nr:hypothetical protein C2G38_2149958 [Gigaspora rosea]
MLKKEVSESKNLDDASRIWILKIKDISNMKLVEKWKKQIKVELPSNMINKIPEKNMKPEQCNKVREKDNVVNKVIKRPEEEKGIHGYKTAKPTKSKVKEKNTYQMDWRNLKRSCDIRIRNSKDH